MTVASSARERTANIALVTTSSAVCFALLGIGATLPGALLPELVSHFDIRLVQAGSMLALQPVGYLVSVLAMGRLTNRFGLHAMLRLGLALYALGFFGFAAAPAWTVAAATMLISGIGFGVIDVATNTLIIHVGGARRSNLLNLAHLFFGVGSLATPVASTRAVAAGVAWQLTFVAVGCLAAAMVAAWGVFRPTVTEEESGDAGPETHSAHPTWILALLLAVYVGVEMGVGNWLTQYMVTIRAVDLSRAGTVLTVYWLGLTAGRLSLSFVAHRLREETLLLLLTPVAAAALAAGLVAPGTRAAALCFGVAGLGLSGVFPAVIALGGRNPPRRVAAVTSVLIAGAGLGGIVIPWTMSVIADLSGLVAGMGFYAVMCAGMIVLSVVLSRSRGFAPKASMRGSSPSGPPGRGQVRG